MKQTHLWRSAVQVLMLWICGIGLTGCIPAYPLNTKATAESVAVSTSPIRVTLPSSIKTPTVTSQGTASAIDVPVVAVEDIPSARPIYVWVSANGQSLYAQPTLSSSVLLKLGQGMALRLIAQSADASWLNVEITSIKEGWVLVDAVRLRPARDVVDPIATAVPLSTKQAKQTQAGRMPGSSPTPDQKPNSTGLRRTPVSTPTPSCDGSHWFFTPHPREELRHFRATQVTQQRYTAATLYYIHELNQTWALFAKGGWTNLGGDIQVVARSLANTVGMPTAQAITYMAQLGDTLNNSEVTAYVSTPDRTVVHWTIDVRSMQPLGWAVLDTTVINCGA